MRASALLFVVLVFGCGHKQWIWSSPAGKECYRRCEDKRSRCLDAAAGDWPKMEACEGYEKQCLDACPDLARAPKRTVVNGVKPLNDNDCWRLGVCDRGECHVVKGRCVPW